MRAVEQEIEEAQRELILRERSSRVEPPQPFIDLKPILAEQEFRGASFRGSLEVDRRGTSSRLSNARLSSSASAEDKAKLAFLVSGGKARGADVRRSAESAALSAEAAAVAAEHEENFREWRAAEAAAEAEARARDTARALK